jgi:heavy metal translocating P-type ATPase
VAVNLSATTEPIATRPSGRTFGPPASSVSTAPTIWITPTVVALLTTVGIAAHLVLRYGTSVPKNIWEYPLFFVFAAGGIPLLVPLTHKLLKGEFGSDLLAGISIVTSVVVGQYLAGSFVILMLSGGTALEVWASGRASSVLDALARRMPQFAHRKDGEHLVDIGLGDIQVGDAIVVFPHEVCPVDGIVLAGQGKMNEAYLTGEPFEISKAPGSQVLSGAINGESALDIRAEKLASDSRYARIMQVMQETQQRRPTIRRLGDKLGAWYTPAALMVAGVAWAATRDPLRFLAVLVVATPCPLLIAIPVAVVGAISLSARRGIIIRNPAILEQIDNCRTIVLDKTGTLTYGQPSLSETHLAQGWKENDLLALTASLEQYSKHPLAQAVVRAARDAHLSLSPVSENSEKPHDGLRGSVGDHSLWITGRKQADAAQQELLPAAQTGLECVIFVDGQYAGLYRFEDAPRRDSSRFVNHLKPRHHIERIMIVSGDREPAVRHLADQVGIGEIYSSISPEEKVEIVRRQSAAAPTLFLGDGINDAPAMQAATVGVAFGVNSDVTSEAADAVVMEASLSRVDELIHIGRRMRAIALQSAVGGMALSIVGMLVAAFGLLPPVAGAITQEVIDLIAVLNAIRVALPTRALSDF